MVIIVGLGNPGSKYENTRHNVGFMLLDRLREKLHFSEFVRSTKFSSMISECEYSDGVMVYLVKPQTFMNSSGISVANLAHFYKISMDFLWVAYDDIDLPLGKIRFREKGSAGTHNGMKSIISSLGASDFPRFRIGIDSRDLNHGSDSDLSEFVLQPFAKAEREVVDRSLDECVTMVIKKLDAQVAAE